MMFAALCALGGCAPPPITPYPTNTARAQIAAVTYRGDLVCADCEAIQTTLTLFPDQTYRLRRIYRGSRAGAGKPFYELGRWSYEPIPAERITLRSGKNIAGQFRFAPPDRLRMLDGNGKELPPQVPSLLARQPEIDPLNGPMPLRGMFSRWNDEAVFDECTNDIRYTIAQDGAYLELARTYLGSRTTSGDPILISIVGSFVTRAADAKPKDRESITVEKFDGLRMGQTCGGGKR